MTFKAIERTERVGQSLWLDYLHRKFIENGQLRELINEGGIRGLTSNPSIFEKAFAGDWLYSDRIGRLLQKHELGAYELYEAIAIDDIQAAAEQLRPVYDRTGGKDGYVSLEVSPYLADDTEATVAEAKRLWTALDRPNVMIKVPATPAGIPAIERLIADGLNVNVTLLFSTEAYRQVAEAYLRGLEKRAGKGADVSRIASVASFFVSRVDNKIDPLLAKLPGGDALAGKAGVANAKVAYQTYLELVESPRWQTLAKKGAKVQRLLWASTSVKNPKYPELLYVEELMGPDTVDTLPPATYQSFREKGTAENRLAAGLGEAKATMAALAKAGVSYEKVTAELLTEGVALFKEAFDKLLTAVEQRRVEFLGKRLDAMTVTLPKALADAVAKETDTWTKAGNVRRLWARDASLWTGKDEAKWLGWLDVAEHEREGLARLEQLAYEVSSAGIKSVVLLGMGGSSLAPDVLARMFGRLSRFPALHVLDSTSPDQIRAVEGSVDLTTTLFVVSSKSGSTLEPNILRDYFFQRMRQAVGELAAQHFVAVTDPGSQLETFAREAGFRATVHGEPTIGGRYSALSAFGLVPAALMGLDVGHFLDETALMAQSCGALVPPAVNPGVRLGLVLGTAAKAGRDKVTIFATESCQALGGWLEQLLAESTGKQGKGLIPVDLEPVDRPEDYGDDRLFVYLGLADDPDPSRELKVRALEAAGHPVVWVTLTDPYHLGQEFFRWEIATAVAGAVLGINPFDQPDVEAAKIATRDIATAYEKDRKLPGEAPRLESGPFAVFGGTGSPTGKGGTFDDVLKAFLGELKPHDYFAALAFLQMNESNRGELQRIRRAVLEARRVATCVGFGPRFLHSTGQAYKGGPATGCFLVLTGDPGRDLAVPEKAYTFGQIQLFQGLGDYQVLKDRGRRALRIHIKGDVGEGLTQLRQTVERLLGHADPQRAARATIV